MSAAVELRQVSKRFGAVCAAHEVTLKVEAGEFLTLLGPSGCGKTTLLRLIAGFETPDAGQVWIGGEDVTALPAYRRNVNQVFQSYALFPHLDVRENIAFGLRMQRLPAATIAQRVGEVIALVALEGCERQKPHQLSGGQQQRVALARALAPRPAVLLLDEPLSALDEGLRQAMQIELKRLQRQVGTTFVFVTHDQEEALTISDRIAVMHRGRIEHCGSGHQVYHEPATAFVAEFIGHTNLLEAELIARMNGVVRCRLHPGLELDLPGERWPADLRRGRLSIRPEKLHLSRRPPGPTNAFPVRVQEKIFRGAHDRFVLDAGSNLRLIAVAPNESAGRDSIRAGDGVWCAVHPADIVVLPGQGAA